MKQYVKITIICLTIISAVTITNFNSIYATLVNITTIGTNNGIILAQSNGAVQIYGGQRITTNGTNSTMMISSSQFQYVSTLKQVRWNPSSGITWFNPEMTIQSNDPYWVASTQPYDGTIISISFTPVYNAIVGTITSTIYDNGNPTNKTFTFNAQVNKAVTFPIGLSFKKGDNIEWQLKSTAKDNKDFVFNFQTTMQYDG